MRLRQFTPRQPLSDIPVTQREWQPDPEVVITHDDYTPGRGNVNMMSQYLTAITIIWQHPVHPRLQEDPNRQLTKGGALRESHQEIPQKIPLSQMDHMTKETWIATRSLMRI